MKLPSAFRGVGSIAPDITAGFQAPAHCKRCDGVGGPGRNLKAPWKKSKDSFSHPGGNCFKGAMWHLVDSGWISLKPVSISNSKVRRKSKLNQAHAGVLAVLSRRAQGENPA